VEDVSADSKAHKVVVKGKKAAAVPMKVVERVQKKTGRKVELLSPMPPAEEEKKEEEKKEEPAPPKPEEKKEEVNYPYRDSSRTHWHWHFYFQFGVASILLALCVCTVFCSMIWN